MLNGKNQNSYQLSKEKEKMFGWTGKILHINLTGKNFYVENPPQEIYEKFIGGKGLAGYYLKNHITETWDSEGMPLLFFTGPLVNTPSPTSGRMTIMSRSSLTGTIGDTSVGGKLGTEIKKAGWDGIIITGKSNHLCGVTISDQSVEFKNAESMKQMKTSASFDAIGSDGANAVIGPAAENGVLFANIVVDRRYYAGRNGLGTVMAAKNLKYLKVSGTGKTEIFDDNEVKKAREEIFRLAAASPAIMGEFGITNFGTGALYDLIQSRRMMPTDNFRKTSFDNASTMNSWNYKKQYGFKKSGCRGCHILCKRNSREKLDLPEFETMAHFSALLGNSDLDTVVKANHLCGELGFDTISAAVTLACYSEINRQKLAPEEIIDILGDIGYSKGIGSELKLGSYRYAEKHDRPDASMTVKKSELPGYDPRGAYGMALAYVTSTRGGCHLRAYPVAHEILRKPVVTDRFSFSGKARIIKIAEDLFATVDSLTACKFVFFAASLEEFSKAFYGVTGVKTSAQDLLKAGERIYYAERIMNARNGFTSQDDDLPARFFTDAGSSSESIKVNPINRDDFLEARSNYYKIRGLDEDGLPTKQKCEELELEWTDF